jgi:hypothetical protein
MRGSVAGKPHLALASAAAIAVVLAGREFSALARAAE